mgnify:CR=1 FL=1
MLKMIHEKRISLSEWLDEQFDLPARLRGVNQYYAHKYSEHNFDSLESRHYTLSEIALGLMFFLFDSLRRMLCGIFGVAAFCTFLYFLGGDILQFLKQGEFVITSTGNLFYGAGYSKDFFTSGFEWKGVGIILGNLLLIPAFVSIPGFMIFLAAWSDPD